MVTKRYFCVLVAIALTVVQAGNAASIDQSEYRARREAVAKALGPNALLILMSPEPQRRNGDVTWPFRQNDELYYLTGVDQANTTLALLPGEKLHPEILFTQERDLAQEAWTGRVAGHDELVRKTEISEVVADTSFESFLKAVFEGRGFNNPETRPYYSRPFASSYFRAVKEGKAEVFLLFNRSFEVDGNQQAVQLAERLRAKYPELRFRDATPIITALREVKSPREIASVQMAIDITVEGIKAAMRRAKTAAYEYQLQATLEFTFRDLGAEGWGYPSIVGSGMDTTTLHLPKQDGPVVKDGLVLLDVGAQVDHYTADVTQTFPANGKFSSEQKAIYEAVYRTSRAIMTLYKPKNTLLSIHKQAFELIGKELFALGLITSPDNAEQEKLYFMHGVGHPLGLSVHDVFDRERALPPSMIATNEPGIYVNASRIRASDTWKKMSDADRAAIDPALKKYDGIGVRIEDDILVTSGEPKILSSKLPRTVAEIEQFMK